VCVFVGLGGKAEKFYVGFAGSLPLRAFKECVLIQRGIVQVDKPVSL